MELRCCSKGHYYHGALRRSCPFCLDTIWEDHSWEMTDGSLKPSIADCPDPENTLLFVAHYNTSYQLKQEGEDFSLIGRYQIGSPDRIVEYSITLSAAEYKPPEMASIQTEKITQIPRDDAGDSRLLINIGQMKFDHRWQWNLGISGDAAENLASYFEEIFRRQEHRHRLRMFREDLLVDLSDGWVRCVIWCFFGRYRMVIDNRIFAAEIRLPQDAVREICLVLSACGLFEKNTRRFTEAEIDTTDMPIGHGCVKHVLVKPVVQYLVDCFIRYRDKS